MKRWLVILLAPLRLSALLVPPPLRLLSLSLLPLSFFLCAGTAFGENHRLAFGIAVAIPDGWEVSLSLGPGAIGPSVEESVELLVAAPAEDPALMAVHIRVSARGAEIAETLRQGGNGLKIFHVYFSEALRLYCKKQGIELLQIYSTKTGMLGKIPCIKTEYLSKKRGYENIFNTTRLIAPVGKITYELLLHML